MASKMIPLERRIGLLHWLREHLDPTRRQQLIPIIRRAQDSNPWFTFEHINIALDAWFDALQPEKIEKWLEPYRKSLESERDLLTVGLVLPGNLPLVGLHDLICVMVSGHNAQVKLSSKDTVLMKWVLNLWYEAEPSIKEVIQEVDQLRDIDAIIATGSTHTMRVFKQYFGKYPNIIRGSRTSVAVLTGDETESDIIKLGYDVFTYFGFGCRNVSYIFAPKGYDWKNLLRIWDKHFINVTQHNLYMNNYDYNLSIFLLNKIPHLQGATVLIRESDKLFSPVSVVHVGYYENPEGVKFIIQSLSDSIQCVASNIEDLPYKVPLGQTQYPQLWDYADHVDTMEFLLEGIYVSEKQGTT